DPEEDAACVAALEAAEQEQLSHPLEFELKPHVDRRVRKFGLHRRVFTTHLVQHGGALRPELLPRDQLPRLLDQALQRAIQRQVLDQPGVHDNDHLMINMSSNRLRHAFQSSRVRVRDWRQRTEPAQTLLQQMSNILNSNEQFRIDDSFHVEVSHIKDSGVGSGSRGKRPGTQPIEQFLQNKKSVVRIQNLDELCCARALVTAKAYRDWGSRDSHYKNLTRGGAFQKELARQLHRRARVPEGPCGLGELNLFQIVLAEYQIVVVSADHGYQIIFKGPRQPDHKLLCLIKVGEHYHTCHSLSGFFGKGYYCLECEKSFNNNDLQHHRCPGRKCACCHQTHCVDFAAARGAATLPCKECHRFFFGADCLLNHQTHTSADPVASTPQMTVCSTHKRCPDCQMLCHGLQSVQRHKCGYGKCPSCKEWVPTDTHRCYIQPIVEQARPMGLRSHRGAAAGLATLQANRSPDDEAEDQTTDVLPHPLFVYFDIEARQDTGEHVANLLCAETSESEEQFTFAGDSCIEAFLDWAQSLTRTHNPHIKRKVICIAHNLKGYDSYFILEHCYAHFLKPEQLVNDELLAYCQSDVRLLKEGCQKFQSEFWELAGFNPFEHCITIASACNRFFRKHCLTPQTIASEPVRGWHGKGKLHSRATTEWLYWQEHKEREARHQAITPEEWEQHDLMAQAYPNYPHPFMEPDQIRHAENDGEQTLLIQQRPIHIDGYNPQTRTVYEFHSCFFHGCPHCFPNRRTPICAHDGKTMHDLYQHTLARDRAIQQDGYNLVTQWECEWKPYQQHEGVQLNYAQIEKNPAKRALAKLMLNSFWGKFGQASNKSQVESISSPSKFHRLFNQDDTHIHAIRVVNEEMLEIVYNKIAEAAPIQPHINIFIAAFTTAHAPQARSIPIFNPHKIVRDETTKRLETRTEIKRYQLVASKRVVDPDDFHTYPYGFT
ncbi:unnamed protein product, partial [Porites lobata]